METSLHGIKWVSSETRDGDGNLGNDKLGEDTDEGNFLLVRVEGLDGILETELHTSVHNNTDGGWSNTVVEGTDTVLSNSLLEAISDTVVHLDLTNISTEGGTDIDQWVDDGVGDSTSEGTRGDLGQGEHGEVGVLVVLGEDSLEGILEHKVAGGSWDVSNTVGNITSPEGRCADFSDVSLEAVAHTSVSLQLTGDDLWVGILSLDSKLDLFEWGSDGLGDGTRDTTGGEVYKWAWLVLVGHIEK